MNENERVTLQYTISLKELPGEVSRLVQKAATSVGECHDDIMPGLINMDAPDRLDLKTCHVIAEARERLTTAACALDDVNNIIEGYMRHRTQPPAPQQQPSQEQDTPPTAHYVTDPLAMSGAMAELQEKLKLFQQQDPVSNEEPATAERK
jgi:hypothetical protein